MPEPRYKFESAYAFSQMVEMFAEVQELGIKAVILNRMPKNQLEILSFIAKKGPASRYMIAKERPKGLGIAYSTVNDVVKDLLENRFIKIVAEEPFIKTGLKKKSYDLTLRGLATVMAVERLKAEDAVKKYREYLPLIFGKWNHFVEMGCDDLARAFLLFALDLIGGISALFYVLKKPVPKTEEEVAEKEAEELVTYVILLPEETVLEGKLSTSEKGLERWHQALVSDDELFSEVIRYLNEARKDRFKEGERYSLMINDLEKLRKLHVSGAHTK